jgi:hypothetical protein
MRIPRWTIRVALVLSAALVLSGCDKLTRNHYEMIQQNVSNTDDVQRTIGDPNYRVDGQWHYDRVDKHLNVIIDFNEGGVVVRKQWIDANEGVWEDTEQPGETDSHQKTTIRNLKP